MTEMTHDQAAPVAEESNRRNLFVVGGLVAALALGGGGYVLLTGGSEDSATGPVRSSTLKGNTKRPAAKAPVAKAPQVVPAVSRVPLGRDPFRALYIVPVAAPAAAAKPASTTTTPSTTSSSGSTGTTTTTPTLHKLVLKSVDDSGSAPVATFSVGAKLMIAKPGSVFGPTSELKLLSLTEDPKLGWIAALQVGDSEPVDVSKGQTLYVR